MSSAFPYFVYSPIFPEGSRIEGAILQNLSDLELVPNTKYSLELGEKQAALIGYESNNTAT